MRKRKIALSECVRATLLAGSLLAPLVAITAQEQVPATAPQVQQVLPSYEGQNVVSSKLRGVLIWIRRNSSRFCRCARATVFAGEKRSVRCVAEERSPIKDVQVEKFAHKRTGYGFCWFVSPHSISVPSTFPVPRANLPTRACCRLPTTRRGDRIRLSTWRAPGPHSRSSSSRTATSKPK